MSDEQQIRTIREFLNDTDIPKSIYPWDEFLRACYTRWAVNEMLTYIVTHVHLSPVEAIEEYRDRIESYKDCGTTWAAAYETANDILYILEETE